MNYLKPKEAKVDTVVPENNNTNNSIENKKIKELLGVQYDPLLESKLEEGKFSIHNPPPDIDWVLTKHDHVKNKNIGVAAKGEMVMFYGPPKCRKSSVLSCITTSLYDSDPRRTLGFKLNLRENESIIYFDTEMPKTVYWKRGYKLNKMCKHEGKYDIPDLHMHNIKMFSPYERIAAIEYKLGTTDNVGVIVIDQIGDLVHDINDRFRVNELLDKMSFWGSVTGAVILSTLHVTWNTEKMTGVIGSEIGKKMSSGFFMHKVKETKCTVVEHNLARDEEVEDFEFKNDSNGYPYLVMEEDLNF